MQAVIIDRFGDPDVLHLAERPRPEPKPAEVLIRTRCAGVNYIDALTRAGRGVAVEGEASAAHTLVERAHGRGRIVLDVTR